MTSTYIHLSTAELGVTLDPGHGADVLEVIERATGINLLFETPWRKHADAVRAGAPLTTFDPTGSWLERYRGGWQTLCPVAGDPRVLHGAPVGFHGEASVKAWSVVAATRTAAHMTVDLFSVPVRIDRSITLEGSRLELSDRLTNLSDVALSFDYSQHPAFGGPLLDGPVTIATNAAAFVADPEQKGPFAKGVRYEWPIAKRPSGADIDLRMVPAERSILGWLTDFADEDNRAWAEISNSDLELTVRIDWEARVLPYAWFWQELNSTQGFPWFRRARALAIEPASGPSGGARVKQRFHLGPHEEKTARLGLEVFGKEALPQSRDRQGEW